MQNFSDKRCFLPHVNRRTAELCPERYTINPDNEFILIRDKELWKGSYTVNPGYEEGYEIDSGGYHSSSGNIHVTGQQSSSGNYVEEENGSSSFSESKEETVQLSPQEISLKLRISKNIPQSATFALIIFFIKNI